MAQKTTGFASPAQGYEEQTIDFNRLLITNPPATIIVRLDSGDMEAFGLSRGALLVVDRSKKAAVNTLVMIRHEGRFLCRLMTMAVGKTVFTNGVNEFCPVPDETEIIGTVTASINTYHDFPR